MAQQELIPIQFRWTGEARLGWLESTRRSRRSIYFVVSVRWIRSHELLGGELIWGGYRRHGSGFDLLTGWVRCCGHPRFGGGHSGARRARLSSALDRVGFVGIWKEKRPGNNHDETNCCESQKAGL